MAEEAFTSINDGNPLNQRQAWTAACMAGKNPTTGNIKEFWEGKGLSEEDTIDLEQFQELCDGIEDPSVEAMIEAMKKFDKDDSDCIDREELISILKQADDVFGTRINEDDEEIDSILKRGDTNEDGKLSIKELAEMIIQGGVMV